VSLSETAATERFADDLGQALELGRAMAAEKAAEQSTTKKPSAPPVPGARG
jgi:hypothetical protein